MTHVALFAEFDQTPPAAVMDSLRSELDSIMAPAGLQFEWHSLAHDNGEVSAELAVVSFKGRCDSTALPLHSTNPGALGWTHLSDGVILPFSDVDCNGVRAFLGARLLALRSGDRSGALGRALGRVLAHELYHIFANTTRHATDGAGKPAYSVEDLLSAGFSFAKRETLAIRPH